MHWKYCAPPIGIMRFQVMSPLFYLFFKFLYTLCRSFIHYFADPTLRTTDLGYRGSLDTNYAPGNLSAGGVSVA